MYDFDGTENIQKDFGTFIEIDISEAIFDTLTLLIKESCFDTLCFEYEDRIEKNIFSADDMDETFEEILRKNIGRLLALSGGRGLPNSILSYLLEKSLEEVIHVTIER